MLGDRMFVTEGEPVATDVVIHAGAYNGDAGARAIEPWSESHRLHESVWIGRLQHDLGERVMEACGKRGQNFSPARQFGASYAFVRLSADQSDGHRLTFDPDRRLWAAVALSRLIHPTSLAYEYAARRLTWSNGAEQIVPVRQIQYPPMAFVATPATDWLNPSNAPPIADVLAAYWHNGPHPRRLYAALWYFEATAQQYFVDLRWPSLTTALEALIRVKDERAANGKFAGSTRVFKKRLARMSEELADGALTEDELSHMYATRSSLSHGTGVSGLSAEDHAAYRRKEKLARDLIVRGLNDASFRAALSDDNELRARYPIE